MQTQTTAQASHLKCVCLLFLLFLPGKSTWTARPASTDAPWVAVIDVDGRSSHRRDLVGY